MLTMETERRARYHPSLAKATSCNKDKLLLSMLALHVGAKLRRVVVFSISLLIARSCDRVLVASLVYANAPVARAWPRQESAS